MTKRIFLALVLLMAMPTFGFAQQQPQSKPWATLCNGVLTFSYGPKPIPPSQVTCTGCGKKIAWSTNYCSSCGAKNPKDFIVYDALGKILPYEGADWYVKPWYEKRKEIKKVVFNPSFRQVTNITSTESWFQEMSNLTTITGLEYLNTAKVTNMAGMFQDCLSLETIDLSHFNTSKVTDMGSMFCGCYSLKSLNLSNINTNNVTHMRSMFDNCRSLTSLDVSHFNTANVTDMADMFCCCYSLKSLNLSSFNTSKVERMDGMFYGLTMPTLDISNFDTRKALTGGLFRNSKIQTIYVSSNYWNPNNKDSFGNDSYYLKGCNAQIIKK